MVMGGVENKLFRDVVPVCECALWVRACAMDACVRACVRACVCVCVCVRERERERERTRVCVYECVCARVRAPQGRVRVCKLSTNRPTWHL